jgi:hypothetical protein
VPRELLASGRFCRPLPQRLTLLTRVLLLRPLLRLLLRLNLPLSLLVALPAKHRDGRNDVVLSASIDEAC